MEKPTTRMTTYDVKEKPEKWQAFTEFTHNQMTELIRDYGKVDILWLDGGQVTIRDGLDIKMEEIVPKLREINPDLIVADRTAGTEFENYITPELLILSAKPTFLDKTTTLCTSTFGNTTNAAR